MHASVSSTWAATCIFHLSPQCHIARFEIEALSEDGVIEGVSMPKAKSFVVGVQWHAEFRVTEHPFNMALYSEFGEATKRRAIDRFKQPNSA